MKRLSIMMLTIAGVLLALVPAHSSAQCGGAISHAAYFSGGGIAPAHLQLVAGAPDLLAVEEHFPDAIVGLWKMDFEAPAYGYSDKGYQVWHSDHTEFLNSTRPPSTGAVCQGVWERVGESTYRLNHFAMGYSDGIHLDTVFRFKEVVTVSPSGDKLSGTFTIQGYNPQTHSPVGPELKGTVTGDRVKIDTGIDSQDF